MFSFLRKSAVRAPSPEIVRALAATAGSAGRTDFATAFKVVEMGGKYSGRKVTHIRVFDPATIAARGVFRVLLGRESVDAERAGIAAIAESRTLD